MLGAQIPRESLNKDDTDILHGESVPGQAGHVDSMANHCSRAQSQSPRPKRKSSDQSSMDVPDSITSALLTDRYIIDC